jgi:magnesium-transporting ATPase (P-type)
MGDGINDAPALKAADIGISVDTAVDIAKESAHVILLQKDLNVLEDGIIEGRKTYANMIKYIKMTASSNFGNIFSELAAAALLPFFRCCRFSSFCSTSSTIFPASPSPLITSMKPTSKSRGNGRRQA